MRFAKAGFAAIMTAVLSINVACALEPVDPQPATPLTYSNPAYH